MAFTYCTNCGEKIDDSEVRCPHCGHVRGQERSYTYGQETENGHSQNSQNNSSQNNNGQNGYGQNGYNQNNGQNGYNQGNGQNGYNQGGYNQGGYGQGGYNGNNGRGYNGGYYDPSNYNGGGYNPNGYNGGGYDPYGQYPPQPPQKRPLSVGLLIFSIINIIFGCCATSSLVMGVVALIMTIGAQNVRTDKEEADKKKIALILNIIAIVLTVITVVSTCAYVMIIGIEEFAEIYGYASLFLF